MLKKMSSLSTFFVCLLHLGCPVKGGLTGESFYRKPVYPDKNLQEILVYGNYYPEDPSGAGEESFDYSRYREYCYNKTDEKDKRPIFKKNLRTRLYDKEGHLLSEDFLRLLDYDPSLTFISNLPYHDEGYKIHVVRLKGKKEIILYDIRTPTQSRLREISFVQNHITKREGWVYNKESECHIAAFD